MSIRQDGGWYIDGRNNRWDADRYTAEQAEAFSSVLRNCTNCINCTNCVDCINCSNCSDCDKCNLCGSCRHCTDCCNCADCGDCRHCSWCNYCDGCSHCGYCNYCDGCNRCGHCSKCTDCGDCYWCSCSDECDQCAGCNNCSHCGHCGYCDGYTVNPQRIYGWTMGSRDDIPKVYWVKAGEEQCVVGCFRGTLDELEARVKETHKDNPKHLHDYLRFIKAVRAYQEAFNETNVQ